MIKIITDSSADIPEDVIHKYDITIVPLTIKVDGNEYYESIDITSKEFFNRMFASRELPKTSQPSPSAFAEAFNKFNPGDEILCFTISSGISGTYQSACLGQEISQKDVTVFNSQAGSLGHGLQVIRAAELANKGLSRQEILNHLKEYRENINIIILLNTLENIVKGGRLSKVQGSIAKILDIRVILEGIKGEIVMKEKIRGQKKFYRRTLELISERKTDFSNTIFGITHTGNLEDVEYMKNEIITRFNPKEVLVNYMGSTMGTYAGKNGMIISF